MITPTRAVSALVLTLGLSGLAGCGGDSDVNFDATEVSSTDAVTPPTDESADDPSDSPTADAPAEGTGTLTINGVTVDTEGDCLLGPAAPDSEAPDDLLTWGDQFRITGLAGYQVGPDDAAEDVLTITMVGANNERGVRLISGVGDSFSTGGSFPSANVIDRVPDGSGQMVLLDLAIADPDGNDIGGAEIWCSVFAPA
ncbi:hypothetical protein GCM10027020_13160 [Nocardioides salsibiostraticola]